ncbi:hypothetical protein CEXT_333081 [Caerostris extrusa]|uniref:Uncharacterized protein n=1 Tax=Caerostris extrusa TaxID=172846 RepID=A0AAV4VH40_CAEEX|nr:hypothetical protein CEXT_333081 [Caerostris extrusa]
MVMTTTRKKTSNKILFIAIHLVIYRVLLSYHNLSNFNPAEHLITTKRIASISTSDLKGVRLHYKRRTRANGTTFGHSLQKGLPTNLSVNHINAYGGCTKNNRQHLGLN